jgi:hypothetical protein
LRLLLRRRGDGLKKLTKGAASIHQQDRIPAKEPRNFQKTQKMREKPEIIDPNKALSEKELEFSDLYFSGQPLHKAVKLAGYRA